MREQQKHLKAYEYYLSLGGQPTVENCSKVSDKFQITERTFWNWYKKFDWKERVCEVNELAAHEVKNKAIKSISEWKEEQIDCIGEDREKVKGYMDTLHMAFEFLGDRMDDGVLVAKSMQEVMQLVMSYAKLADTDEKRIKLALLLMGEADSRGEQVVIVNDLTGAGDEGTTDEEV